MSESEKEIWFRSTIKKYYQDQLLVDRNKVQREVVLSHEVLLGIRGNFTNNGRGLYPFIPTSIRHTK